MYLPYILLLSISPAIGVMMMYNEKEKRLLDHSFFSFKKQKKTKEVSRNPSLCIFVEAKSIVFKISINSGDMFKNSF